jgi:hypothetical protein
MGRGATATIDRLAASMGMLDEVAPSLPKFNGERTILASRNLALKLTEY